jgi:hypothetical protein
LGLAWLSGLGTWVMPDLGIELKKNIVKKEKKKRKKKREDIISIE